MVLLLALVCNLRTLMNHKNNAVSNAVSNAVFEWWLNWEIFFWAFLHGRFKGEDGLIIRFFTLNTTCYARSSGQISYGFSIRPQLSWDLVDDYGYEVLGVKNFSDQFIPF